MKRKVSKNVMNYLQEEIEKLEFGSVSVEVFGDNDKIDIVTKRRKRFQNGNSSKEKPPGKFNEG